MQTNGCDFKHQRCIVEKRVASLPSRKGHRSIGYESAGLRTLHVSRRVVCSAAHCAEALDRSNIPRYIWTVVTWVKNNGYLYRIIIRCMLLATFRAVAVFPHPPLPPLPINITPPPSTSFDLTRMSFALLAFLFRLSDAAKSMSPSDKGDESG